MRCLPFLVAASLVACGGGYDQDEQDVIVDTESELSWAQYQENLGYARAYLPRCGGDEPSERPRVLVTGFGRFMTHRENATGRMVSQWLEQLDYPLTDPPPPGGIDPVAPQVAVARGTTLIAGVEVDVCAMVLPVFWDLAAVLITREAEAFGPDLVLMNGIAGGRQPLWLEMGALNRASRQPDGSDILAPVAWDAPIIEGAELARPNLASWEILAAAAEGAIAAESSEELSSFGEVARGAWLAGYPRVSNTYLCNNTTYAVGHGMDHPGEPYLLMEASHPRGEDHGVVMDISRDMRAVPRLFVHWPSELAGAHLDGGTRVMQSLAAAQLAASDPAVPGDNELADLPASDLGGESF